MVLPQLTWTPLREVAVKKVVYMLLLFLFAVGSFLAHSRYNQHKASAAVRSSVPKPLYYVDPMHPAYRSDKPGVAPDCGMQLEPVYAGQLGTVSFGNHPASLPA